MAATTNIRCEVTVKDEYGTLVFPCQRCAITVDAEPALLYDDGGFRKDTPQVVSASIKAESSSAYWVGVHDDAVRLALSVLQEQWDAALLLSDEVQMRHTRKSNHVSRERLTDLLREWLSWARSYPYALTATGQNLAEVTEEVLRKVGAY